MPRLAPPLTAVGFAYVGNALLNLLVPTRAAEAGLATALVGLLMTGYYAGYVVGCAIVPRWVARYGHRRVLAALAVLSATVAAIHAADVPPGLWLALRAASGFALAGLALTAESWVNAEATEERRVVLLSVYRLVELASISAGQLMLGVVASVGPTGFLVAAVLVALAAAPMLVASTGPQGSTSSSVALARVWRAAPVALTAGLAVGVANGAFWTMTPVFGVGVGLAPGDVSLFMTAWVLGGAAMHPPLSWLDRRMERRWILVGVTLAAALAAFGTLVAVDLPLVALGSAGFVLGGCSLPIYTVALALANHERSPDEAVAISAGLLLTFGLGAIAGPSLAAVWMEAIGPVGLFVHLATVWGVLGFIVLLSALQPVLPQTSEV